VRRPGSRGSWSSSSGARSTLAFTQHARTHARPNTACKLALARSAHARTRECAHTPPRPAGPARVSRVLARSGSIAPPVRNPPAPPGARAGTGTMGMPHAGPGTGWVGAGGGNGGRVGPLLVWGVTSGTVTQRCGDGDARLQTIACGRRVDRIITICAGFWRMAGSGRPARSTCRHAAAGRCPMACALLYTLSDHVMVRPCLCDTLSFRLHAGVTAAALLLPRGSCEQNHTPRRIYHGRAELGPLGEGRPVDMSACMVCDGVIGARKGAVGVMQSDGPRPPRRQHRGGTPGLESSGSSGRSQQRGDDTCGGEDPTPIVAAPTAGE
jgi:hypothetical protein